MAIAPDHLTTALGTAERRPNRVAAWAGAALRWSAVAAALLVAGVIATVVLGGGGSEDRSRVVVAIGTLPAAPEAPPVERLSPLADGVPDPRSATGVTVVSTPGGSGPLILRIPDAAPAAAAPVDPRLIEPSRFGNLPRIAPDGLKPLDAYARPSGELAATASGRVALVVGGLGISQTATQDAIVRLPAAVTLAFAPYGAGLDAVAGRARDAGHEILLQVPMEPFDYPDSDPGPHTLRAAARPAENMEHLHWSMARLAGYVGLVNYMGGKVTADERALAPVLKEAASRGLAFLDDGSSSRSVTTSLRTEARTARADVVVDAAGRADDIDKALARLEALAASGRVAVGTASALPLTISRIEVWSRDLASRGVALVPISAAFAPGARESAAR